jgi:hypothetical protein
VTAPAVPDGGWAELRGALPDHSTEVLSANSGSPSIETQSATHGAPLPAEDRGLAEGPRKYG